MDKKKINRIIDFIREEMMTTNGTPGKPGFSGKYRRQRTYCWIRSGYSKEG